MAANLEKHFLNEAEWRELLFQFPPEVLAWQMLTAQVPYLFRNEPFKYASFRKLIGQAFSVEANNVFIIGSALVGKSLEAGGFGQAFSPDRGVDVLVVSEPMFATWMTKSMHWLAEMSNQDRGAHPSLGPEQTSQIFDFSSHARLGIWLPESLPAGSWIRNEFSAHFSRMSVDLAGLLSQGESMSYLSGRVARSIDSAAQHLADRLLRLKIRLSADAKNPKEASKAGSDPKKPNVTPRATDQPAELRGFDRSIMDLLNSAS